MSLHQAYRGGCDGRPGWWLHFDYDPLLIEKIKKMSAEQRAWDEEKKRWWIGDRCVDQMVKIMPSFEVYLHQKALF